MSLKKIGTLGSLKVPLLSHGLDFDPICESEANSTRKLTRKTRGWI